MTVWGSIISDSTNAFRIGYDISQSPSTVSNGTVSTVVTLSIKLQTKYYANDSGADWTISGDIAASGSTAFDHNSGTAWSSSNITTLATRTKTVTTSFTGPVVTNGSATVTGLAAIAGTASVSWSITTAQRPVGIPAAPTGCTATRFSDTQQNIAWTNTSPTSASNPYSNVVVQRSTDGGAYVAIATLGVVTSYSDKTTSTNHRYQYRVYAKNGAGNSSVSAATSLIYTTPRAPTTPVATKTSGGDIGLTWTDSSSNASGTEVWHAANGVWDGAALATISGSALTYTHVAPSTTVTHTYRLRYKVTPPALTGPYSGSSNVVALTAPPNAPTNLSPNGVARDLTRDITATWQHNPVDTTAQTSFQIQWRVVGAPSWTVRTAKASSVASDLIPAGTFGANPAQIEYQVRTWGAHATASAWSASAIINGSATPVVGIINGSTYNSSVFVGSWTYSDDEGTPQAQWEAILLDSTGAIVETRTGAGTATSTTFSRKVLDGSSYTLKVRVQDGSGLWSDYDVQAFTVTYSLPEVPTLLLAWNSDDESVSITIDNPPTGSGKVDTVSNEVWRSIDGGPWLLVADNVPNDGTVVDPIPSLGGVNLYKVVAISALPSSVESDVGVRPQLVTNPSFETDTSGWTASLGTIAAVALAQAVDGVNALEYTSTTATAGNNYVRSNLAPAVPGKTYEVGAYVRVPVGSTLTSLSIEIQWLNAGGSQVAMSPAQALTVTAGDEMRRVSTNAVCPVGATQVAMLVFSSAAVPVGQKFQVDLASMAQSVQQSELPQISTPGSPAAVVNAGTNFGLVGKVALDVNVSIQRGRAKVLQEFEGRTLPEEFVGQQRSRTVALSGKISNQIDTTRWVRFEEMSDQPAPACYRDPDGRRIFVSMGDVQGAGFGQRTQQVTWTLTEVGWTETVQS